MNSSDKTWPTIFVESAIATGLFVCATIVAGFLHHAVSPDLSGAYVFWFALAMLPFLLFARNRGAVRFDRWDLIAFVPFLLCIAIAGTVATALRHTHPAWIFAIPATAILCCRSIDRIRARLPRTTQDSDHITSQHGG